MATISDDKKNLSINLEGLNAFYNRIKSKLLPTATSADSNKFLRGDGTWSLIDSTGAVYANKTDINNLFSDRAGKFTL